MKSAKDTPLITLVVLNSSWKACSSMFHSTTLTTALGLRNIFSRGYFDTTLMGWP